MCDIKFCLALFLEWQMSSGPQGPIFIPYSNFQCTAVLTAHLNYSIKVDQF